MFMIVDKPVGIVRLVLGDQLYPQHSWFTTVEDNVTYVLMEVRSETDYVPHHIQKVAAIFHAMRSFTSELQRCGHRVRYFRIGDGDNVGTIAGNLKVVLSETEADSVEVQEPDEWRLDVVFRTLSDQLDVPVRIVSSEHYLTTRTEVSEHFAGRRQWRMESFYRYMRQKHNILMEGDLPVGGEWNYDADNRKKWKGNPPVPPLTMLSVDVSEIVNEVRSAGILTVGEIDEKNLIWPTTPEAAEQRLQYFATNILPFFGPYQDAISSTERTLFHSLLSFALNVKILHPWKVISVCLDAWKADPDRYSLASVEGFVRQIIGWREYVRGVYWAHMPEYAEKNFFNHHRPLPVWYWTGQTNMNCLRTAITSTLTTAYAHHIQRLMVTGAFALMAGCDPDEVDTWYLGVYIDAFEWVEITNTRGMSQMADGGLLASKPYLGTATYINKMSDHCGTCSYDRTKRIGDMACPLNSLYWHFHHRHRDKLQRNVRLAMTYRQLDRFSNEERTAILDHAERILSKLDTL